MTIYSQFLMQPEIKPTFDSSYVIVGAYTHPDYSYSVGTAQLTKFTEQGEFLWQRNNFITDTIQHAIEMRDVIQSSDSGFVMVGALTESGVQKGYVVKTNCLGFLGEPVASASHIIEQDYEVVFYNTSMQAGSYTWYFGDGDSLLTNEYVDTLFHTYADSGSYQVQLVAHGCNGRADTIEFDVFIAAEIDTFKVIHGNAYFTIFPNPSATNDDIYIYLNELDPDQGVVWLDAITMTGQLADQVNLSPMEGSYQIHSDLASGVYVLTLYQGDRRLQQEKLVVK